MKKKSITSKRYEFNITQTHKFIVGIEAESEWEAREIFDELISDDFGDPASSVLEIDYVMEEAIPSTLNWVRFGRTISAKDGETVCLIESTDDGHRATVIWNHYTRWTDTFDYSSDAMAAVEKKLLQAKGEK